MPVFSFSGTAPENRGVTGGKFRNCPSTPNCVCSDATDRVHRIAPLRFSGNAEAAWGAACLIVENLPRTAIVLREADYLHAECESPVLGFVDDLELHLRPGEGIIAVRSAARLGYWDFGVNRKRVEAMRRMLEERLGD